MAKLLVAVTVLAIQTVQAQSYPDIECNADGYVLQRDSSALGGETIYLGKSCDAYSDAQKLKGRWCWSNAGVLLSYSNGENSGIRLELPHCPSISTEIQRCQCS